MLIECLLCAQYCSRCVGYLSVQDTYEGEPPRTWNLFIKNFAFILICLNFSHLQSTLYLVQYTYKMFFPLPKTVFELLDFNAFLCFCRFFVSPLPHGQNVSLWGLFSSGKQKVIWGKIEWIQRMGHRVHAGLGQKLLNTQNGVGRCTHKSLIIKWETRW